MEPGMCPTETSPAVSSRNMPLLYAQGDFVVPLGDAKDHRVGVLVAHTFGKVPPVLGIIQRCFLAYRVV